MLRLLIVTFIFAITSFHASAEEQCGELAGDDLLTQTSDSRFIIFGDQHGSQEMPAVFADAVCIAAKSGKKVKVALEIDENLKTQFSTFIESSGTDADVQNLLRGVSWELTDGKASVAMLDLMKRFRSLRESGFELSVVPFMRAVDISKSQAPYEKALATSLMEIDSEGDHDLVMVLVGRVHALKEQLYGLPFEPMAMHLPKDKTSSILLIHSGGTTWSCQGTCGVHDAASLSDDNLLAIRVGEQEFKSDEDKSLVQGYDGLLNVGDVTASPPAKPQTAN